MKFQRYFKGVSKKFQGYSKKVFMVLQGSFKGVSMEYYVDFFDECFTEVLRGAQGRLRGDLSVSKRSSKGVKRELRQVQRCFEEVSKKLLSVFQDNLKKRHYLKRVMYP